jgi:hypothetical protein
MLVQAQAEQCLNDDELRLLGSLLQEHATVMCLPAGDAAETGELRINYDGFNSVSKITHMSRYAASHNSMLPCST